MAAKEAQRCSDGCRLQEDFEKAIITAKEREMAKRAFDLINALFQKEKEECPKKNEGAQQQPPEKALS